MYNETDIQSTLPERDGFCSQNKKPRISVGLATCGRAVGGQAVFDALEQRLSAAGIVADLAAVGCRGLCYAEPLVEVVIPDCGSRLIGWVDPECAGDIVTALSQDDPLAAIDGLVGHVLPSECMEGQERRVLSNCGLIDPLSLEEYCARGGYAALRRALAEMSPKAVIHEVTQAGLRGRGGAGFPTGRKWNACTENDSTERYFIVNADEGDPGAYMDRALLESDPHCVLEGLIIACYATGVHQAYVFIRA
ncbi:MAG: NADH-quinone oxidoreductase subunit F, partial [Actinobacteria bacterium]|nr:NADH-quinone oxidoreductase subunit F [Actinomycetota bacterium]